MQIGRLETLVLLGGPALFLAVFFLVPFGMMATASMQSADGTLTSAHYVKLATDGHYWSVLLLTFKIGAGVVLLTFLLGYPLAYYLTFHVDSPALRRVIYIILVTPLFTSTIVRAFGWIVMLGRAGLVN